MIGMTTAMGSLILLLLLLRLWREFCFLCHMERWGEKKSLWDSLVFLFHIPTVTSLACLFFLGGLMKLGLFY